MSEPLINLQNSPEEQVKAAAVAAAKISQLISECVDAFERSPSRLFISERLLTIRNCLSEALMARMAMSKDYDFICIGAVYLLPINPKFAEPILFDLFARDIDPDFIANAFAKYGIAAAVPSLIDRLKRCVSIDLNKNRREMDIANCLVDAIRQLGATLPTELVDAFSKSHIPGQLRIRFVPEALKEIC
jgi:hypothetical protein